MSTPILDWVPRFDPESRKYPIRTALATSPTRRNKTWRVGPILDQGREGACVGFGWTAEALATPVAVDLSRLKAPAPSNPTQFALSLYNTAKTIDEFEGEDYSGTSVLAGAKGMKNLGIVKEYRWAFRIDDVVDALLKTGPVVLGTNWHQGMYEAPGGVLTPKGKVVGGHCYTAVGYRVNSPLLGGEDGVVVQNSWGSDWGNKGLALIRVTDLENLLDNYGEACVPYRRSYGR